MEIIDKRHYAVIDTFPQKVKVEVGGMLVAESTNVLLLKEVGKTVYNPVFYFPKEDVNMNTLEIESGKSTFCPIKGEATYWSHSSKQVVDYFAWSYEQPLERSKKIAEHIAFNPNHVKFTLEPNN